MEEEYNPKKKKNPGCLIFILGVVFAIVSGNMLDVFQTPSLGNIYLQVNQINQIEDKLYDVLQRVDEENVDDYAGIKQKEKEIEKRTKVADDLYTSIPEGEVIKKGIGENLAPVGTYKKVVKLREQIARDERDLHLEKDKIAIERGAIVPDKQIKLLWQQRAELMKVVDAHDQKVSDYKHTFKGRMNGFLWGFFAVLLLVSICAIIAGFFGSLG